MSTTHKFQNPNLHNNDVCFFKDTSKIKASMSASVWWQMNYATFLQDNLAKHQNFKCIYPMTSQSDFNPEFRKINEIRF